MSHPRFRILRSNGGGLSLTWTLYSDYRLCPRLFWWRYCLNLHSPGESPEIAASVTGGPNLHSTTGSSALNLHSAGVQIRRDVGMPNLDMLYGSLWHACYRGRLLGREDRDSCLDVCEQDGQEPALHEELFDEVSRDLDWYAKQPRDYQLQVLACEESMSATFGRHEARATPDLVGRLVADWGGRTVNVDHKTTKRPNDSVAFARYRESRQITFQLMVLRQAHPEWFTFAALASDQLTGMLNVVPSHACSLGKRAVLPDPVWAFRQPHQLERMEQDFVQACNEIEARLALGEPAFPENPHSCVMWRPCSYIPLCSADDGERPSVLDALYEPRYLNDQA